MRPPKKYRAIGLMSGTSLDGLDLACIEFSYHKKWSFRLVAYHTHRYGRDWKSKLENAHTLTAPKLMALHHAYGAFLGKTCKSFMQRKGTKKIDLIASHGHTVFHQPKSGFTFQLGDGNSIHAVTSIPVVCDFRSLDVALGGQGAPLVPQGDRLLFSNYDACLNLGGIANISMETGKGKRKAFDICFCNMALNFLMGEAGESHDRNGDTARKGSVNNALLKAFVAAHHSIRKKRLSIGRELFERELQPLLMNKAVTLPDRLRTACEMIAIEITAALPSSKNKINLLATGGGALNLFLVDLLKSKLQGKAAVIIPPREIIEFKEALIFGFLGVLRLRQEINVLSSVTRASTDSCSGVLIGI